MYISSRLLKVIDFLRNHNNTSIKEVSKGCNITERMARYDIDSLNFILRINKIPEIEKLPKGVLLTSQEFINSNKVKDFKELNKYSKEERTAYIKAKLLIDGKVNLSALSKELNVSRTSIRGDMSIVIEDIEDEYIKIVNNEIVSDERSIRHTIIKNFSRDLRKIQKNNIDEEWGLVHNYLRELCIDISQSKLKGIIEGIEKDMNNENPNYFYPVWLHIIVAFMRIKNGNYREELSEDKVAIGSKSYKVVRNYINELNEVLEVNLIDSEVLGFSRCIESCMSNKINSYIYENWVEIVLIIKETINEISDYTGINLRNDEALINGLINHIKAAIYRIIKNIDLEIDICNDIVQCYDDVVSIVRKNFSKLEDALQCSINDYEITLITIHLIASVERNKEILREVKNILLVCGGGYGTTSIIANKIKSMFNVNIVDMVSYSNFLECDLSKIDYVISILKVKEDTFKGKKIIKITPFITEKDILILSSYLPKIEGGKYRLNEILDVVNESLEIENKGEVIDFLVERFEKKKETKKIKSLKDYIDINKVAIIDRVYSWQESIVRAGELLEKTSDIDKEYTKGIIAMAENIGAHFVLSNGIAIPHGEVNVNVNNSSIGVLYVKDKVAFDYGNYGNLFFMIAAKTTKDHVRSIEEINRLSINLEFINGLRDVNTEKELVELIMKQL
ncbi:MAG: BglG family transcription antiterminator [Clostridium sp.]